MERRIISFELRVGVDDDIYNALIDSISKELSRSTIIRNALRNFLLQNNHNSLDFSHIKNTSSISKAVIPDENIDQALDNLLNF